ncbi:pyridoxamine 5'-phosphate oxidase [Streptomyces sp. NPDC057654]|uniref:pyridoxamine 5'-phosphate oxidase n=1 Tax=Streptomyces sp. NPDC057654 TaxID=3346196 RepID=UPI0036C608FB
MAQDDPDSAPGTPGTPGSDGSDGSGVPGSILRALDGHTTMTLAYIDEDGPQACAVLYARGGGAEAPVLHFVTSTSTRHGRALDAPGARAAFTAQRDGQEWTELTGMQGRGGCRRLAGAERADAWRTYTERFPFTVASERLRAAMEATDLWELRPDWLRLIDNAQGFGHKREWSASR